MNPQFLTDWLATLRLPKRARALDLIMYDLTISARDLLRSDTEDKSRVMQKLLGFNELYHQLSQQIGHYLDGEEIKVYPIEVFSQILFDKAVHYDILPFLVSSIMHARTGSWSTVK